MTAPRAAAGWGAEGVPVVSAEPAEGSRAACTARQGVASSRRTSCPVMYEFAVATVRATQLTQLIDARNTAARSSPAAVAQVTAVTAHVGQGSRT